MDVVNKIIWIIGALTILLFAWAGLRQLLWKVTQSNLWIGMKIKWYKTYASQIIQVILFWLVYDLFNKHLSKGQIKYILSSIDKWTSKPIGTAYVISVLKRKQNEIEGQNKFI